MGDHAGANAVPADPAALTMLINLQNAFVKSAFYVNLKLGEAVRVLNIDFRMPCTYFSNQRRVSFDGAAQPVSFTTVLGRHSAELRIALQGAADICEDPHMRTSVGKFIHEAPAAEMAKMNWQRMESDRYLQEATGEEMHK